MGKIKKQKENVENQDSTNIKSLKKSLKNVKNKSEVISKRDGKSTLSIKTKKKNKESIEAMKNEVPKLETVLKIHKTSKKIKKNILEKETEDAPKKSKTKKEKKSIELQNDDATAKTDTIKISKSEGKTKKKHKAEKEDLKSISKPARKIEKKKKSLIKDLDSKSRSIEKSKFGKKGKSKKPFPKNKLIPSFENAPEFDEKNFNNIVQQDNVKKMIKALTALVKKETSAMKNTIFSDYIYTLNVCAFRIPSCPKRIVKLKLKHSLVGDGDDVVFIVKDLKRGMKVDYEPTVHHYEDLLREKGIENIKAIVPFTQLRKEYQTFEMKRKFSNLYDYFICDGAIVGHVVGFLGNTFSTKSRCTLHTVRTGNENNLKSEIRKALNKTAFKQGEKGNLISIAVGNHTQTPGQVADNIMVVIEQLKNLYPGGLSNIRNMELKVNIKGTSSLPIYISMAEPPRETPYIIGKREQKINKLKDEANEILSRFALTNEASIEMLSKDEVEAKHKRKHEKEEDNVKIEKKKIKKSKKENKKAEKKMKTKDETLVDKKKKDKKILKKKKKEEVVAGDGSFNGNDISENEDNKQLSENDEEEDDSE